MFNMGPAYGLTYVVAPVNGHGKYELYSECYRDYPEGGFATYRNSCGLFDTYEAACAARKKLEELDRLGIDTHLET